MILTNYFAGPALVTSDERDLLYCGGNYLVPQIMYASISTSTEIALFHADGFNGVVVPCAGHKLNLDYVWA